jgi:hypothetical protein
VIVDHDITATCITSGFVVVNTTTRLNVYIDSNVWNFLFERQIDLAVALPSDKFCLSIPCEVELEIGAINPSVKPEKEPLKTFIEATIAERGVRTDAFFGFYNASLPHDEQRAGGFGWGRFPSPEEVESYKAMAQRIAARQTANKRPSTPLYKDEADISLAVRAVHSVVLSLDAKPGHIPDASQRGGKVVFLTEFDTSGLSLSEFILQSLAAGNAASTVNDWPDLLDDRSEPPMKGG